MLFADLKGSMELLADRDPEEARKLLDPVLERMMEAVHRYEGTVNQVMGDGIMALFGAPVAHEDHAVRACYAAHDMQATMRRYTEEVRHAHGIELQIRVGLNSGEVVVRAIGSDLRMDYSAVGQTTHLAARMEQLATPGTIRLTADTLRLAEGYIEVKPLGAVPVKGLETRLSTSTRWSAQALIGSRLHAAAARGLTRFVGREAELERLRQALGRAAAGHGQVVALVGEPGVGKSRLVWEVTHSHRTHGWLIVQGELRVLREGHAVPARDRPAQGLLQDPRPGRSAGRPREGHRQAPGAGRGPEACRARVPGAAGRAGGRRGMVGARPAATPSADPGRGQASAPAREPGPAAARRLRGSPLDRRRDPGVPGQSGREPAGGPDAPPRELPPRVHASLGQQDLLHAAPARPPAARERRGPAGCAPRARTLPFGRSSAS